MDRRKVGPEGSQAVHIRVVRHKTRKFYGPADIIITRALILPLVDVSCGLNGVETNDDVFYCSH